MSLKPGTEFAGYRIINNLGAGGMGEVYLVENPGLGRQEALKVISSATNTDPSFAQRFAGEARNTAALQHPNIIAINAYGIADNGTPWMAMPLLTGHDLTGQTPDIPQVIAIARQVADGLDYAHHRGIIHRDIKPANIFQTTNPDTNQPGDTIILDLGIAKATEGTHLTATGSVIGTIAYLAPEILEGQPASPQSDQYALACTLYQLLTGTTPYTQTQPSALMAAILDTPAPPLSQHRPDLTAANPVLARALNKNPAQRYPNCRTFTQELAAALTNPHFQPAPLPAPVAARPAPAPPHTVNRLASPARPTPPPPVLGTGSPSSAPLPAAPKSSRRLLIAGAIVAVVVLTVGVGAFWMTRDSSGSESESPLLAGQLTSEFPTAPTAAWTVSASSVGASQFVSLDPYKAQYGGVSAAIDAKSLVTQFRTSSSIDKTLLGVDLGTGESWESTSEIGGCVAQIVDGAIACTSNDGLQFIDAATGKTVASFPMERSTLAANDTAVFARSGTTGSSVQIAKYTPKQKEWEKTYQLGRSTVISGDTSEFIASNSMVMSVMGTGLVVDAATGEELTNRAATFGSVLTSGGWAAIVSASLGTGGSAGPIVAFSPGNAVREIPGSTVIKPTVVDEAYRNVVWIDGQPIALGDDKNPVPSMEKVAVDPVRANEVPLATTVVIVAGNNVLDGSSGKVLWTLPEDSYRVSIVTDGKHLIWLDQAGINAAELGTGKHVWQVPFAEAFPTSSASDASPNSMRLEVVGDKIIALGAKDITAFEATGGPASAPSLN